MFFGRGKNKVQNPYTLRDMYKDYLLDHPEGTEYYVTSREYTQMVSDFYNLMSEAIINEGIKFNLPWALGDMFVIKKRLFYTHKMPIDWKATNEVGHAIFNFNNHTSGYTYNFFWSKPYKVKYKHTYRFVFTRKHKRALAKAIKENKMDYLEK